MRLSTHCYGGYEMDFQVGFNIAISLAGALAGYVLKSMQQALRDLTTTDATLVGRVQSIEVLVAGQYVHKNDMDTLSKAIFHKLDRIEDKLDGKVDRADLKSTA